jgi:uncharacterized protein (DUF1330 family)
VYNSKEKIMAAYIIVRVTITDAEEYKKYLQVAPGIIELYGGKAIVRTGKTETLEGEQENRRIVVLEFPSMEKAREFYYSGEYQEAKKLRENAARGELIIVEGLD